MKHLAKLIIVLILCGAVGGAAEITITSLPVFLNPSDTIDVYLGLKPGPFVEILAFSIDVFFTDDLVAGAPLELGFFADNGVFFSYTAGAGSLTGISDAASGPTGLTTDDLVARIRFTFLGPGELPTAIWIDPTTSYLLDSSFMEVPFTIGTAEPPPPPPPPMGPPAEAPEPATFGLAGVSMIAVCIARRRRRL